MAWVWWLGRVLNFCVLGSLLSLSCLGNGLKIQLNDFASAGPSAAPAGWQPWAQREEVMPRCYIDTTQFRSKSIGSGHFRQQQRSRIRWVDLSSG